METTEERRFGHGMIAGIGATLAGGAVSLLMLALHLWPTDRPVTVAVLQMLLHDRMGVSASTGTIYVLAGLCQLAYGAVCGGMLAALTDTTTRASALGMGAIRWSVTMVLTASALGWGDFGLLGQPWIAVQALFPHLAWALTAGWLIHQEETGHVELTHPLRALHLAHAHPRRFTSARDTRRR